MNHPRIMFYRMAIVSILLTVVLCRIVGYWAGKLILNVQFSPIEQIGVGFGFILAPLCLIAAIVIIIKDPN